MQVASKCGLGQSSPNSFISILENFKDEIFNGNEVFMESNDKKRAPISQQAHIIEKPADTTTIGGTVTIEINDKSVSVPLGTTILDACRQEGIHIPTLCHHDDLCVAGVCRICVVEIEGMRTLQGFLRLTLFRLQ